MPWTTPETFTAGQTLTAASMNAITGNDAALYARDGLVLIKTQTVGSAVSSVEITNAFSTTYRNYRITYESIDGTVDGELLLQMGSANSAYYGSLFYYRYDGAASGYLNSNNASSVRVGLVATDDETCGAFDISRPFVSAKTMLHGTYYSRGYSGWFGGVHATASSYTSFTLLPSSGTMTGGTVAVYGYGA